MFADHPLFTTQHLGSKAAVVELRTPLFVECTVLSLEERAVHLTIEAVTHILLQRQIDTVVARISFVDESFVEEINHSVNRTERRSAHTDGYIETILIVGIHAKVEVIVKLISIGCQQVMSLCQSEVVVHHAVVFLIEIGIETLCHRVEAIAQRERTPVVNDPFDAGTRFYR